MISTELSCFQSFPIQKLYTTTKSSGYMEILNYSSVSIDDAADNYGDGRTKVVFEFDVSIQSFNGPDTLCYTGAFVHFYNTTTKETYVSVLSDNYFGGEQLTLRKYAVLPFGHYEMRFSTSLPLEYKTISLHDCE